MASPEIAAMQMALESSLIMATIVTLMMPKVVIYSACGEINRFGVIAVTCYGYDSVF